MNSKMNSKMKDLVKVIDSDILHYNLNSPGFRHDVVVYMEYKGATYTAIFQRHDNYGVAGDWYIEENACQVDLIDMLLRDNVFDEATRMDVKDTLESYLFSFITNTVNFIRSCDYVLSLLPSDEYSGDEYFGHDQLQNRIDELKTLSVTDTDSNHHPVQNVS